MAKPIKFTEEEVSQINQLRQDVADVFTKLGQIQIEKKRRIEEVTQVEDELLKKHSNLVQLEQDIFKGLNEKYVSLRQHKQYVLHCYHQWLSQKCQNT